jgi:hypothetical protein
MELSGSVEAAQCTARLLAVFRSKGLPVNHMQHVSTRPAT